MKETRERIGKLYAEGKWNQDDEVAAAWAKEFGAAKPKDNSKKKDKEE